MADQSQDLQEVNHLVNEEEKQKNTTATQFSSESKDGNNFLSSLIPNDKHRTKLQQLEDSYLDDIVSKVEYKDIKQKVIHILMLTVKDTEFNAAVALMEPIQGAEKLYLVSLNRTYIVGRYGPYNVALVQLLRAGKEEVINVVQQAVQVWKPKAIFNMGVAIGRGPPQNQGDLLVAERIVDVESAKHETYEHTIPEIDNKINDAIQTMSKMWRGCAISSKNGQYESVKAKVHKGLMLSVSHSLSEKDKIELWNRYKNAIGADMESFGVYTACHDLSTPWLVCKAIIHWGDGAENKDVEILGSYNAASFMKALCEEGDLFSRTPVGNEPTRCLLFHQLQLPDPDTHIDHPLLSQVVSELCSTKKHPRVALIGMGGVGKTTLAGQCVQNENVRKRFPQGVVALTVDTHNLLRNYEKKSKDDDMDFAIEVLKAIFEKICPGEQIQTTSSDELERHVLSRLSSLLKDRLVVLDNVWDQSTIGLVLKCNPAGLLVTTRTSDLITTQFTRINVKCMSAGDSHRLLLKASNSLSQPDGDEKSALNEIVRRCGGLPLALRVIAGLKDESTSWKLLSEDFSSCFDRAESLAYPTDSETVFAALDLSVKLLPSDEYRRKFFDLVVFPRGIDIPLTVLADWWGIEAFRLRYNKGIVAKLVSSSLASWSGQDRSYIRLHDLCFDYLHDATHDQSKHQFFRIPSEFNQDLFPHSKPPTSILRLKHVDILQECRKTKATWEDMLVKEQPYFFEYLPWHFDEAGLSGQLERLCCSGTFMDRVDDVAMRTGLLRSQLNYWMRAESGAEKVCNYTGLGAAKTQIGRIYMSLGQFHKSLEYHNKSLEIAVKIGDVAGKGRAYGNIGVVYQSLGNYEKALEYLNKRLEIAVKIGDIAGEGRA